jgi:hypothetical protein
MRRLIALLFGRCAAHGRRFCRGRMKGVLWIEIKLRLYAMTLSIVGPPLAEKIWRVKH